MRCHPRKHGPCPLALERDPPKGASRQQARHAEAQREQRSLGQPQNRTEQHVRKSVPAIRKRPNQRLVGPAILFEPGRSLGHRASHRHGLATVERVRGLDLWEDKLEAVAFERQR